MKIPEFRTQTLMTVLSVACALAILAWPGAGLAAPQSQDPAPETADADRTPAGFFTERVDVRVVNIDVVVTDRSGQPIAGLAKENFELRVDGRVTPIDNFYSESGDFVGSIAGRTDRPATDPTFRTVEDAEAASNRRSHVVVLVDHSRLSANNRKRAFKALREAVDRLDPEDLISVVGVEGDLVFYSDFLYDRTAIHSILDRISRVSMRTNLGEMERRLIFGELARGQSGGIQARASQAVSEPILSRIRAYAAEEYNRSITSMRQIETVISTLSGVPGRKALLYLGEGIPTRPGEGLFVEWRNRFGSGTPQGESLGLRRTDFNTDYSREIGRYDLSQPMIQLSKAANRAEVTLYAVDAEGSHGAEVRSALTEQGATSETLSVVDENFREPLEAITKATGGKLLRSSGNLADQLLDVVGEIQTFYSLGFAAPDDWSEGSDHNIEVRVKGQNFRVRHREAVTLPAADEREASATIATLMYQAANNPLSIEATPGATVARDDGNRALPIDLAIPIEKLGFLPQGDNQSASLTIYVSTRDAKGQPGKVQKIPFHLELPEAVMAEAMKDSARYPLPLVLRPGDRHIAIGVRDNVNGVFSAIRLDVAELSRF